jgi:hypothetical protein
MGYSWKNFSLKSKLVTTCIFITVGVCVIFSMTVGKVGGKGGVIKVGSGLKDCNFIKYLAVFQA